MRELKSIDIVTAAKVSAVVSAIWGFIVAILTLAFIAPFAAYADPTGMANPLALGIGFGVASIIITPILMAIMGFIMGAIGAFFYNVAAKYVGGIKLDL
jgi:hypothetical protein